MGKALRRRLEDKIMRVAVGTGFAFSLIVILATSYYSHNHIYKSCKYVERMGAIKNDTYVLIKCPIMDEANMKADWKKQ